MSALRLISVLGLLIAATPARGGDPVPVAPPASSATGHSLEQIVGLPLAKILELPAADIERAHAGTRAPEAVRMLRAILHGSQMGAGEGWFGPARSRYSFEWLADLYGVAPGEPIRTEQFTGPSALFDRLDRNHDGKIEAVDLDWSDDSAAGRPAYLVNQLYRKMDPSGDGRLTRDEWVAFFDRAKQGKDYLTSEDLRDALVPAPGTSAPSPASGATSPAAGAPSSAAGPPAGSDAPTKD